VLVLSRVTLGADVAVTSVILRGVQELFPRAAIVFVGGTKSGAFFAADPRIEVAPLAYRRGGTLFERLHSWVELTALADSQIESLSAEEYLIIDPDSRLTQLGLLPLTTEEASYFLFESRSYGAGDPEALGPLAARWLDETFSSSWKLDGASKHRWRPYVKLGREDLEMSRALRQTVAGPLAAINLGVGGNASKRIPGPFELELLRTVLGAGYAIVLDRGLGSEEAQRTANLIAALASSGVKVGAITRDGLQPATLMTWEGTLSAFAGLIGVSDLYIGYDSAGSHLAAALGVPCIDIFSGAVGPRLVQRWRPWGTAPVRVIASQKDQPLAAVLEAIRAAIREHTA
jgi:ADP-heptose:LPS heptosyltransferase